MEQTLPVRDAVDPDRVIAGWAASGARYRQVAAALARELRDQDSGAPLESSIKIAARLGADHSTAVRARDLLLGAGFICQEPDRHYRVA